MASTLGPYRLDSQEVPFPIGPLPHAMIWSTARGAHAEITWLRDRLRRIAKNQFAGLAA